MGRRLNQNKLRRTCAGEVVVFRKWMAEERFEIVVDVFVDSERVVGLDRAEESDRFLSLLATFREVERSV